MICRSSGAAADLESISIKILLLRSTIQSRSRCAIPMRKSKRCRLELDYEAAARILESKTNSTDARANELEKRHRNWNSGRLNA